jgi:hypothetical protein
MKSLMFAAATVATAAILSPVSAEGPKASGSNFIAQAAENISSQSPISVEALSSTLAIHAG